MGDNASPPPARAPLTGVRVLDLTRLLPGAFATLMLAELGAEVIKIEDPRGGDPMRHLPPIVRGRGIYDLLLNRGKKSVALDLRATGSREILDALIARSDIVIESFRPGTARRLGVAGPDVRARFPRVIHCAITGYGQDGPYAERPGHDLNYVSVSGFLAADRPHEGELPRMFIADIGAGAMSAVVGMLAALYGRERTGEGATIDISMHDAALYWVMIPAATDLVEGGAEAEGELPTFGAHACYKVYRTKDDRRIALGALEPKFWVAFCEAVGRGDLVSRHHDGHARGRAGNPHDESALIRDVAAIFLTRTRGEWLAFFEGHDVCLTPVNTPAEAFVDPHIQARGTVVAQPGLRAIRPPFVGTVPALAAAPELGADTGAILSGLRLGG